jgi:thiol:disulfide interchange protein DsbD
MNVVKFIMGYMMICMAIYYLNFIIPIFKYFSWPTTQVEKIDEKKSLLNWIPYSENALQSAIQNNRPVMIDFFAEWCAACHELKDKTFTNPEFIEMSAAFDLIVVDATEDNPEIQKILTKYKVKGLPTVIFVNKKGTVINDLTFTQFLEWKELKPKMRIALDK